MSQSSTDRFLAVINALTQHPQLRDIEATLSLEIKDSGRSVLLRSHEMLRRNIDAHIILYPGGAVHLGVAQTTVTHSGNLKKDVQSNRLAISLIHRDGKPITVDDAAAIMLRAFKRAVREGGAISRAIEVSDKNIPHAATCMRVARRIDKLRALGWRVLRRWEVNGFVTLFKPNGVCVEINIDMASGSILFVGHQEVTDEKLKAIRDASRVMRQTVRHKNSDLEDALIYTSLAPMYHELHMIKFVS